MEIVPRVSSDVVVASPMENWDASDMRIQRYGKTEGDVEQQRQLFHRIRDLGLMDNKLYMERQLINRLDDLMVSKEALFGILNDCRRKRPLKARLKNTLSEIRKLIQPSIIRNKDGVKVEYIVSILMGHFSSNVVYRVFAATRQVAAVGETSEGECKLTKEVTIQFPSDVDMSRVTAVYSAGVFKVSVPFVTYDCDKTMTSLNSGDEQSMRGSVDTDSVISVDDRHDSPFSMGSDSSWV